MKSLKILGVTAALAAVLLVAGALSAQAGYALVRTEPAAPTLAVGQITTVNIRVDNVTGLAGAEIHMSYNPSIVQVLDADPGQPGTQIAPGTLLKPDLVAQNQVDAIYGVIDFGVLQLPPSTPANGSGVLATITFQARAPGASPLTFNTVNLSTASSTPIAFSLQHGQVIVSGSPVPTPPPYYYPTPTPPYYNPPPQGYILGYHTVRAGETLYCIGRAYAISPWAIASQNGLCYPYTLRVGQVLAIPNVPWTNMTAGPVCQPQFTPGSPPPPYYPPPPPPPPTTGVWYQVQAYDTLESIAARFGVSVYAIMQANNLASPYSIYVGQWLFIPGAPYVPTPPLPGPYPDQAWLGLYFDNMELGGSPAVQRLDPAIDFDWGQGSPFQGQIRKDFFSVRWTRNVYFEGGTYRFWAWVDDGVRLYVDNRIVVNEWRDSNGLKFFGDATVTAGVHEIKVEYYERAYDAMISVWWEKLR